MEFKGKKSCGVRIEGPGGREGKEELSIVVSSGCRTRRRKAEGSRIKSERAKNESREREREREQRET